MIDGNDSSRIFEVAPEARVRLVNLFITNGNGVVTVRNYDRLSKVTVRNSGPWDGARSATVRALGQLVASASGLNGFLVEICSPS
jgi:hypothetical protein